VDIIVNIRKVKFIPEMGMLSINTPHLKSSKESGAQTLLH